MSDEVDTQFPRASNTRKKNVNDGNLIINDLCIKLKVSTFTRTVAQILFQKSSLSAVSSNTKKLAVTCLFLAAKITDYYDENEIIKSPLNDFFDSNLECKICQILNFSFDYIDIFLLVKEICKIIHKEDTIERRLKTLDSIYSTEKINKFNPVIDSVEGPYLAFVVFDDDEINLFKTINCIEIDKQLLENCRKLLNDV